MNSDVCQEQGSKREAKLAHVTDVMKERFEDDCLLSAPSRADNREVEYKKLKKVQLDSSHLEPHTKTMSAGATILAVCRPIFLINASSQHFAGCNEGRSL